MLVEFPFTTAAKIAGDYRPGGGASAKSILRTLRSKDALSDGVVERLRDDGGRVAGEVRLYCSLNRDAARMVRRGEVGMAQELAARASEVENQDAALELVHAVSRSRASGDVAGSVVFAAFAVTRTDEHLRNAMREVVGATQETRERLNVDAPNSETMFGRLIELRGSLAELAIDDADTRLTLPIHDIDEGLRTVGSCMRVLWEHWGDGRALVSTIPALDLDEVMYTPIYPYDRPVPSEETRTELPASLAGTEPTIRRPRPINIGLSQ